MRPTFMRPITTPANELDYHSPMGWSGAERHFACHGSVALATSGLCPPEAPAPAAIQGTIAHAAAAYWLLNGRAQKGIDTDMENRIRRYVYSVWDRLPKTRVSGSLWLVEARVTAKSIHPDASGTVDNLINDPTTKVMQVDDYKDGTYRVEVKGNKQLMGYALSAREQYRLTPDRIELRIHQPKVNPEPSLHVIDPMELDLFEEEVREHVEEIEKQKKIWAKTKDQSKLDLHAGDQCRYCPAWAICHERQEAAKREGIDVLLPVPATLPPDAAKIVAFAKAALPWAQAVLKAAKQHAMRGGNVPGFKLVAGKRAKRYLDPENVAEELTLEKDLGGLGLKPEQVFTEPKLKSPNQILDSLPKEAREAFEGLWEWVPGAPVLVEESDKRAALKVRPEDWFQAIGEEEEDSEEDEDY